MSLLVRSIGIPHTPEWWQQDYGPKMNIGQRFGDDFENFPTDQVVILTIPFLAEPHRLLCAYQWHSYYEQEWTGIARLMRYDCACGESVVGYRTTCDEYFAVHMNLYRYA